MVVFGGDTAVPVQGVHSLIVDVLPQTFMVTLMLFAVPVMSPRNGDGGRISYLQLAGRPVHVGIQSFTL